MVVATTVFSACTSSTSPDQPPTHPEGVISSRLLLGRPHGVSIGASGAFCISQIDANMVTCGTLSGTNVVLGNSIGVGTTPAHISIDPAERFAYTANQTAGTATIVDIAAGQAVGSVALDDGGFNVLATSSRVYLTTASGQLVVVDAVSRAILARLSVGAAANGLALDQSAGVLYVSSRDAATVTSVDIRTNTILRTYPVGGGAQRVALSPDGTTLYIAAEAVGAQTLNVATGAVGSIVGVHQRAVGLALSPDGKKLYVTNPPQGELQIVDVASGGIVTASRGPRASPMRATHASAFARSTCASISGSRSCATRRSRRAV